MNFDSLPIPNRLKRSYQRLGGQHLRRWVAKVPDGVVRVLAGFEPTDAGTQEWHASISVGVSAEMSASVVRLPTDEECRAALAMMPDRKFVEETGCDSFCRHWYAS